MDNKSSEILREQIKIYLIENQVDRSKQNCYKEVAERFGVNSEYIRTIYKKLRKKGVVENTGYCDSSCTIGATTAITTVPIREGEYSIKYYGESAEYEQTTDKEIKTLEDLLAICKVDLSAWEVERWQCKKWDLGIKNALEKIETKALFSVNAKFKKRTADNAPKLAKDIVLKALKEEIKAIQKPFETTNKFEGGKKKCLFEINIPDLHIGKLAWGKETGDDYDIKIACQRFKDAIRELINRTDISSIGKILLPVGNDLINVDNKANTTTAGTPQSADSRFGKMFQAAKHLLIDTISELSQIAPVDVVIIPGNHDNVATFTLGEVLDAWFHANPIVNVINTHTPRKYYKFGLNLIMYVHGDKEKLNDLGILCATEQPELWAATKYRRVHVGHFHHNKQIKFVDLQEFPGFTVKILNSLSANDIWHAEKGYMSLKQAEAFLYHEDKGLLANYYYQI